MKAWSVTSAVALVLLLLALVASTTSATATALKSKVMTGAPIRVNASEMKKVDGEYSGFVLSNGVIQVELNGVAPPGQRYPCITRLWVDGTQIVPPIAVGALFQMDIRGQAGNNMNPTQSGACSGAASVLDAYQQAWGMIGSSRNGLLMGVTPRTFLSDTGACTAGFAAPYYFNWGVQLGDDVSFPKEAMVIVQQFWPTATSAPPIVSNLNELPTVYYDCAFALYAYYLPDNNPSNWQPLNHPATGSNYLPNWPLGVGFDAPGWGNMRCNSNDFATATCGATYSGAFQSTAGGSNSGSGGCNANLVPQASYLISSGTSDRLSIFAVGNPGTISAAITQTAALIPTSMWGNL